MPLQTRAPVFSIGQFHLNTDGEGALFPCCDRWRVPVVVVVGVGCLGLHVFPLQDGFMLLK